MDHYAIGERRMPALLPICGVRTVYSRTGDLFAWSCVAGLIFMAGYFGA
jgi:apolipoprotein N-acyltransferase